jgi:Flp pilus assembly protein TadG
MNSSNESASRACLASPRNRPGRKGAAVIEATLLCPWVFFIFVGAFDVGIYLNTLISTENAARTAGLYYASSQHTGADLAKSCRYALEILRAQTNVRNAVGICASSGAAVNRNTPVALSALSLPYGPDGQPVAAVTVTYQTVPLIPIPLMLSSQLAVTRSVQYKE